MRPDEIDELARKRLALKNEYTGIFGEFAKLLFRHDPMKITFEVNEDEYEPEVGTILPRLKDADSPESLRRIIHEEFVRWFALSDVGPESDYGKIAEEAWVMWLRHKQQNSRTCD